VSLRARLALAASAAVAVAAVLAAGIAFVVVRHELRGQVDETLERRATAIRAAPVRGLLRPPPALAPFEDIGIAIQIVDSQGRVVRLPSFEVELPVSDEMIEVAAGERRAFFVDGEARGEHVRILTIPLRGQFAAQLARPLEEVDRTLRQVGFVLLGIALGGIGLAAGLGLLVVRAALLPVRRLTEAVEHVAGTGDLTRRIELTGSDELGRLAARFNEMMSALESSLAAQRQLVADASHELRTPLTSLRTNIEVLARTGAMPAADRERLLGDLVRQLEELTTLVEDVVDLARGAEVPLVMEDVRLDLLVERAVERARAHAPHVRFELDLEQTVVRGAPDRLDRAVANLLDNASKWSPPGGVVDVAVRNAEVTVRDHGPGVDPKDLPRIFDRFYRARAARGTPGSGLGLAIARQAAESHGGSVSAANAEGGGAIFRLKLASAS
jgi:two-component system sensor histidine kinase MprB